jgi:hypothetical protein
VSWGSKLQPTVAASTCEAEYIACTFTVKEFFWVWKILQELRPGVCRQPLLMFGDNQGALTLQKHPNALQRTKHIDAGFQFARDRVSGGCFRVLSDNRMVADWLTKAVPCSKYE